MIFWCTFAHPFKLAKKAKISNRYNQPRIPYGKVTQTQDNITYRRSKKSALSQQVTTRLHAKARQYILTDFNYATLTSTMDCQLPLLRWCHHELVSSANSLVLIVQLKLVTSYKCRSLTYFLSRGNFKPSNERVQIDKRQISKHSVLQAYQPI